MKKFNLGLSVLLFSLLSHAQLTKDLSKKAPVDKPLTIKTTPMPTAGSPNTAAAPAGIPLDLFITNLNVSATRLSGDSFKLTINYTFMNVDTVAVSLADIVMQGWIGMDPNPSGQPYRSGCGASPGLRSEMVNPGASVSRTFYCFNIRMDATNRHTYLLGITPPPGFRIVNETKSQKRVFINF